MARATEYARSAWLALYKGVRAVNLYSDDHAEVERWALNLTRSVQSAASIRPSLHLEIRAHQVMLDDDILQDTAGEREMLVERLYADGVRGFVFSGSFTRDAAKRLLAALGPYCYPDVAPLQPVTDRLHWEPFEGLSFHVAHRSGPAGLAVDALTSKERDWMLQVQRGTTAPAHSDLALEAVWDITGGSIPWPATIPAAEAARLDHEAGEVVAYRVPAVRVGEITLLALRHWRDDPRLGSLIEPLPGLLRGLVTSGRAGEAGRFAQPLLAWARATPRDHHETLLQRRLDTLEPVLLGDDVLRLLFEAAANRTIDAEELATFWQAMLPHRLAALLEFTSVLPEGANRDALTHLVADNVEEDPTLLHHAVVRGPVGPALTALDALGCLPPGKEAVALALDALDRKEPAIQARGLRYLLPMRSRRIAARILPHATSERADVRAAALAYMARYAYRPAFETLRDFSQSGRFANLDLASRCDVCKTAGIVGGGDAERLAWTHLPAGYERLQPDRCVPWIVCLAATGAPAADEYLSAMAASPDPRLQAVAATTRPLWDRRREARGQTEPGMTSSPGLSAPSSPGSSIPGARPPSGSHRAHPHPTHPANEVPRPPPSEDDS